MKILVAIKRVQDYNIKVRPKSDGSDVDIEGIKMGINPFDENALEEALRLKEKNIASEVVVFLLGDQKTKMYLDMVLLWEQIVPF
jgi:electron transfer flavoprotein beta subunit